MDIRDLNARLTPEERSRSASKAGKASQAAQRKKRTLREIARIVNESRAPEDARETLRELGLGDEEMTNAAIVVASVFKGVVRGDMKAVEKWEEYIGEHNDGSATAEGLLASLIDGLKTKNG